MPWALKSCPKYNKSPNLVTLLLSLNQGNFIDGKTVEGANPTITFHSIVTTLHQKNALWLVKTCHMICDNQWYCFISEYSHYAEIFLWDWLLESILISCSIRLGKQTSKPINMVCLHGPCGSYSFKVELSSFLKLANKPNLVFFPIITSSWINVVLKANGNVLMVYFLKAKVMDHRVFRFPPDGSA